MNIGDLLHLPQPEPWTGQHKIPWHEAEFSQRMLEIHLDQNNPLASRPLDVIQQQVDYLTQQLLTAGDRVLDVCCGPGLYCAALSRAGYQCTGLDFAPAAIAWARQNDPVSTYKLVDVTAAEPELNFDLAMMWYGEFQTFAPQQVQTLLHFLSQALYPAGKLVLEMQASHSVQSLGLQPPTWQVLESSIFSPEPHLWLRQPNWLAEEQVAVTRHIIVDQQGQVAQHTDTQQAYSRHTLVGLLHAAGFGRISVKPALSDTNYALWVAEI